uniref:Uncharacterized protein n=1 Tax=Candidatus Kentrum sp. LPFa TaxID=2126335 RepID=A0A450X101_9GAMM|nr:MAG: hypothetical protein BECKLPF1236B_GA0070989_13346 [Candidatus Kentron sp. LPFa]
MWGSFIVKSVDGLDDLNDLKELGDSILRKEKRRALLTLLAIAEEIDNEEIMESIEKLSGYVSKSKGNP